MRLKRLEAKKIARAFGLLLPLVTQLPAAPELGPIVKITQTPTAAPAGFDFDGDIVVWRDNRATPGSGKAREIYAFDLSRQQEIPIAVGGTPQRFDCLVSGRLILWTELGGGSYSIWCCNIDTGQSVKLLSSQFEMQSLSARDGWFVWLRRRGPNTDMDLSAGKLEVDASGTPYLSETFVVSDKRDYEEWVAVISGNVCLFMIDPGKGIFHWEGEKNWDIWAFDFITRKSYPVIADPYLQYPNAEQSKLLDFDGRYILVGKHQRWGSRPYPAYIFDFATWKRSDILFEQTYMATLSGRYVVYEDVGNDSKVFIYDRQTRERFLVFDGHATGTFPWSLGMSDKYIVWKGSDASCPPNSSWIYFRRIVSRDYSEGDPILYMNKGNKVNLVGFGIFERRVQKARKARNPRTKEVINVPEKKKFVFRASSKVKYL